MNFKRILIILIFSLCFFSVISAQESESSEVEAEVEISENLESEENIESEKQSGLPNFFTSTRIVLGITPGFYFNPSSDNLVSGPTCPVFPLYFGFIYPDKSFIAIQPTISYFTMYTLLYDGTVYPAEIENRTALTSNILLNFPVVFAVTIKSVKTELYPGVALLMRYASRAKNVAGTDSGYTGTADSDVAEINKWFWSNGRFIYISGGANIIIETASNVKIGPVLNIYVPVGTIFSGESIQGMIVSAGMKLSF